MNFLNGTVTRADGAPAVTTKEGLSLPVPPATGAREGTAVVYGFRPEYLSLSANGAGLPAHVDVVEPTGADTLVYCKVGGRPICAEFTERHAFAPGQEIRLLPRLKIGRAQVRTPV